MRQSIKKQILAVLAVVVLAQGFAAQAMAAQPVGQGGGGAQDKAAGDVVNNGGVQKELPKELPPVVDDGGVQDKVPGDVVKEPEPADPVKTDDADKPIDPSKTTPPPTNPGKTDDASKTGDPTKTGDAGKTGDSSKTGDASKTGDPDKPTDPSKTTPPPTNPDKTDPGCRWGGTWPNCEGTVEPNECAHWPDSPACTKPKPSKPWTPGYWKAVVVEYCNCWGDYFKPWYYWDYYCGSCWDYSYGDYYWDYSCYCWAYDYQPWYYWYSPATIYHKFYGYCYHYYDVVYFKVFGKHKPTDPGKTGDPGKPTDPGKTGDPGKSTSSADEQSSSV